ncbi:MAG TPA: Spy/CpxP family protein refolding chaperone [Polyangia bacterium]|nr:Spy/CpxP family protein refolding chaperone [Polyangia bacterium]
MSSNDEMNAEVISDPPSRRSGRRMSRRVLGGLAALVIGGALSFSVAQAHGGPGGPGGPEGAMAFRMHKVLDKVGATDAQKAQIKGIWQGLRPQLKTLHEQHAALHQQLTQAMTAATIDTGAIEKLRQQSVGVMDKLSSVMTQGFVQSAQVLTPEQRKQAAAEMEKMREHHHGHFGEGGPGMDAQ